MLHQAWNSIYDDGVLLHQKIVVYMKFQNLLEQVVNSSPILHYQQHVDPACIFLLQKNVKHGIFKSFFKSPLPTVPQICLSHWLSAYCHCPELFHVLFVFISWLLIRHDKDMWWADKSGIYPFSKEGPCLWQVTYFSSIFGPKQHIYVFWGELNYSKDIRKILHFIISINWRSLVF